VDYAASVTRVPNPHTPSDVPSELADGQPTDPGQQLLETAVSLRLALERAGDALVSGRLDDLLESEIGLQAALAVLPTERVSGGVSGPEIRTELEGARKALRRCRRLGHGLSEVVRLMLQAHGLTSTYGTDGREHAGPATRSLLRVRA
jgi:hypothetical protein